MAFSADREVRDRAVPLRVRRTRRSHEIMIPRSAAERQKVNSRKADEFSRSWVRSPMNEEASAGFLPLHARTIDLQREPLPTPSLEKHQVDGV